LPKDGPFHGVESVRMFVMDKCIAWIGAHQDRRNVCGWFLAGGYHLPWRTISPVPKWWQLAKARRSHFRERTRVRRHQRCCRCRL